MVLAWRRHVSPNPSDEYIMRGLRPTTSERDPRKPTHKKVRSLSTPSTSAATLTDTAVAALEPSALAIVEMIRGRTGEVRPGG